MNEINWKAVGQFFLQHKLGMGITLAVIGTVLALGRSCILENQKASAQAAKAAAERAEKEKADERIKKDDDARSFALLKSEISYRISAANKFIPKRPDKAWLILNGQDSEFNSSSGLSGNRLSDLVAELQRSSHNWHGIDKQRVSQLSAAPTKSEVGELIQLLDAAMKP